MTLGKILNKNDYSVVLKRISSIDNKLSLLSYMHVHKYICTHSFRELCWSTQTSKVIRYTIFSSGCQFCLILRKKTWYQKEKEFEFSLTKYESAEDRRERKLVGPYPCGIWFWTLKILAFWESNKKSLLEVFATKQLTR